MPSCGYIPPPAHLPLWPWDVPPEMGTSVAFTTGCLQFVNLLGLALVLFRFILAWDTYGRLPTSRSRRLARFTLVAGCAAMAGAVGLLFLVYLPTSQVMDRWGLGLEILDRIHTLKRDGCDLTPYYAAGVRSYEMLNAVGFVGIACFVAGGLLLLGLWLAVRGRLPSAPETPTDSVTSA